jgi:hypothetical protein
VVRSASAGLPAAADAPGNPHVASFALLAYGFARDADPAAAYAGARIARRLRVSSTREAPILGENSTHWRMGRR